MSLQLAKREGLRSTFESIKAGEKIPSDFGPLLRGLVQLNLASKQQIAKALDITDTGRIFQVAQGMRSKQVKAFCKKLELNA